MFNFFVIGIFTGFIYALVALGYTLVYGTLRLINFAHSEVFMLGAFGGYFLLRELMPQTSCTGKPPTRNCVPFTPSGLHSVFWIVAALVVAAAVGGIVAILLERFAYRPLRRRNAPALTYLIAAIGASYFLVYLANKEFGPNGPAVPQPYTNGIVTTIWGAPIQLYYVITMVVSIVMLVVLDVTVNHTKMGRGIRSIAQDAPTASLMGVNLDLTIAATFALGGCLAGIAGFLVGLQGGVSPTMGFVPALYAFTAAVLGGIGNVRGAMLGGLVLGVVQTVPIYWLHQIWLEQVIAFGVLIVVLIVRPTGLLGERLGRTA
jgi:branched-chain amino acid transport system permease protein